MILISYLLAGVFAGLVAGLLGVGGGVVARHRDTGPVDPGLQNRAGGRCARDDGLREGAESFTATAATVGSRWSRLGGGVLAGSLVESGCFAVAVVSSGREPAVASGARHTDFAPTGGLFQLRGTVCVA